ncbi:MAG: DNRLRE domain-containing protein [Verrucomicrobiales bacterium]|nr:DNRLRE domain-containing protein [Verrucomicrobiales bacterium]
MKMRQLHLPTLSVLTALLASVSGLFGQATEFGNIDVVQNDANNNTTSVSVTKAAGSSPNFSVTSATNRGDYYISAGTANDLANGVFMTAVTENGRNNDAKGSATGLFYATSAIDFSGNGYYIPVFLALPGTDSIEANINVAAVYFRYNDWLAGFARNSTGTNGGTTNTLTASAGINLGTQFTTAGSGVFGLNLTSINASHTSQNGILLVNHAKNEDNYAASRANANGSFSMFVRDNGVSGTTNEQDPIAFVYLPASAVGTKLLKAVGRVNSDGTTDVTGGTFTVTKGGVGQWYLSIPGQTHSTGVLMVSPEGGGTNNSDNIVSYQWDSANSRWIIESRDIPTTGAPVLEDGASAAEDMFSFAFFEAPVVPEVEITSPLTGTTTVTPANVTVQASASDGAGGTVTQVEFFVNGISAGVDTLAPYEASLSNLSVGTYAITAKATDNDGYATTSAAVAVTVTLDPGNLPANTALQFDGVNDYVTMGAAPELGAGGPSGNGFTLECWFRKDGVGVTTTSGSGGVTVVPLFSKGRGESDGSNVDCNYIFGLTTGGLLTADFEAFTNGQNYPITATNTPVVNGQWYHAAVTYDGTTGVWTMYLDGVAVGTASAPAGTLPRYDSIQHFGIATAMTSTGAPAGFFAGAIDEVRVWDHARSAVQIAANKDLEILSAPGLKGRFGLNDGIGNTASGTVPGTLTGGPVWIEGASLIVNDPPSVTLTAPADNTSVNAPATLMVTADASDDGDVAKVEFLVDNVPIGEDAEAPYAIALPGLSQGSYVLKARATDDFGATATSSPVNLTVLAPLTTPPSVAITSPAVNATILSGTDIAIAVDASDTDGDVVKVEYFAGATKLGQTTTAPHAFVWTGAPIGGHVLTAKATDNMTATTISEPVSVEVVVNQAPTISLTAPADDAIGAGAGGQVTLTAGVADPESQALNVTFYGRRKTTAPGPDFTLVTLPDTQFYSENNNNRLPQFLSQTNWIVSQKDALNIAFVAHMGDMVQNGDAVQQEWINADSAMDILENPLTTLLTHGIPWGGAPGNHDQQPIGSPDGASLYWNQYFGVSRWAGRPYFGGNFGVNNDNNYQLFSASGMDFIIVNLEYRSSASQAVLDWADALLKAHPDRRAIVTSHWLIGTGNPASWGGQGQAIYDALKDNPNLFLMLCGHIHGEGQRADTFEGRTVHTVLQDYQSRTDGQGGGGSWLRYFVFSPANNTITAKTYRTTTGQYETDADSEFVLPYQMGPGAVPWVPLGTVPVSAGESTATLDWTGLEPQTEYEWYAAVSDGPNSLGSSPRSFTSAANQAPTITLDAPTAGSAVAKPATVDFAATATDPDGAIDRVEFYADDVLIGQAAAEPYEFAWPAISGTHTVFARAIDNQGGATDSTPVTVTVTNPSNGPPTIALTTPVAGSSVPGGMVSLVADAADTDGEIAKVEYFSGTTKIGETVAAPHTFAWSGVNPGQYTVTARATDNDGGVSTRARVAFTALPNGSVDLVQGLNGYTGTQDTYIRSDSAAVDTAYGNDPDVSVDGDDGSPGNAPNQGLLRFDDLIGTGANQIPAGSVVGSATLTLTILDPGSGMTVHRMLTGWSEASTWNSLSSGVQTADVEAVAEPLATFGANDANANVPIGPLSIDITAAVQAWVDGAPNEGVVFIPFLAGTNGIDFHTSESATSSARPRLVVSFVPPTAPVSVDITHQNLSGGTVEFSQTIQGGKAPYSADWDFGDGSPVETAVNPSHVFPHDGPFTVTVSVTDGGGQTAQSVRQVVVGDPYEITPKVKSGGGTVTGGGAVYTGSPTTFTAHAALGYRFGGWTVNGVPAGSGNPLTVTGDPGLAVEALFVKMGGAFAGRVGHETPTHGTSGYFSAKVSTRGVLTGKLIFGGHAYSVPKGVTLLSAQSGVALTSKTGPAAVLTLAEASENMVTGDVSGAPFVLDLVGWSRLSPYPWIGAHTFCLQVDGETQYGYAAAGTRNTGVVTFKGQLADGKKFSSSTYAFADESVPVMGVIKGGIHSFVGTLVSDGTFSPSLLWSGELMHLSSSQADIAYLAEGSLYREPAAGTSILDATSLSARLMQGEVGDALFFDANDLTGALGVRPVDPKAKYMVALGCASLSHPVTLTFAPKSGLLSGRFVHPVTGRAGLIYGAVVQERLNDTGDAVEPGSACGLFITSVRSGSSVTLTPGWLVVAP